MRRTGIKEQASCLTEDPTAAGPLRPGADCQLVMPVPPLVVEKLKEDRDYTTTRGIGNTPSNQPGLRVASQKRHIGTIEMTPNRHPRWNPHPTPWGSRSKEERNKELGTEEGGMKKSQSKEWGNGEVTVERRRKPAPSPANGRPPEVKPSVMIRHGNGNNSKSLATVPEEM